MAEKSARQAILRSAAAGWIESVRDGRRTGWKLASKGREVIATGSLRLQTLRRETWNHEWLILHLPLPDTSRATRVKIYRTLNWLGFGNPSTALWINPHTDRQAEMNALIMEQGLANLAYAFVGRSSHMGLTDTQLAARAWDLDAVMAHYRELLSTFEALRPRSADAVLFAHVRLVNELQRLPYIDPGLPDALLPAGWRSRDYVARLAAIRQGWHGVAHERWATLASKAPPPSAG